MRHPVIVGWSPGGRVAAHYAYVYGKRNIAALVFVSTYPAAPEPVTGPDGAEPGILSDDLRTMLPITAGFIRKCTRAPLSSAEFEEFFGAAMKCIASARRGASLCTWSTAAASRRFNCQRWSCTAAATPWCCRARSRGYWLGASAGRS